MELVKAANDPDLQDSSFISSDVTSEAPHLGQSRAKSDKDLQAKSRQSSAGAGLLISAGLCCRYLC